MHSMTQIRGLRHNPIASGISSTMFVPDQSVATDSGLMSAYDSHTAVSDLHLGARNETWLGRVSPRNLFRVHYASGLS
jgi:hypothetical protein